jgi:hypothetical protein
MTAPASRRYTSCMWVIIPTHFFQGARDGSRVVRAIRMNNKKRKVITPQRNEDIKPERRSVKTPAARIARMYDGRRREKAR